MSGLAIQGALNALAGTSGLGEQAAANAAVTRIDALLQSLGSVTTGEATFPRGLVGTTATMGSQNLRLSFFTAMKSQTVASMRVHTVTAAGATPTLVRMGLYTVDSSSGDITLVASTANDTALLASANTGYTKALSASYAVTAGTRYAAGLLVVTAASAPTVPSLAIQGTSIGADAPMLSAVVTGQTDLPASVAVGSLAGSPTAPYLVLLP